MSDQSHQMKWILFWSFLILFILMVLGTLGMVFFGFGSPTEGERELMVKGLIGEVAACIIALFYSIFEINKKSDSTEINKIKSEIQAINNNIETLNSGDLNIEADNDNTSFDSSISKYEETINSYDIAPPFDLDVYSLSPLAADIKKDVESTKPFDKKHRESSYKGLKVQWKVLFSSIRDNNGFYNITIKASESLLNVSFNIEKSTGQILKTLDENTPFWICGTIKSIESLWLELEDVKIDF